MWLPISLISTRNGRRRRMIEQYGRVDALVNNAAIGKRKLVQTLTAVDLDTTMRTNFTSPACMAMTLLPR
jgi:NAD(P)-dependent dehydrogenase (short-subunit alcohol dehydrogenase family)